MTSMLTFLACVVIAAGVALGLMAPLVLLKLILFVLLAGVIGVLLAIAEPATWLWFSQWLGRGEEERE